MKRKYLITLRLLNISGQEIRTSTNLLFVGDDGWVKKLGEDQEKRFPASEQDPKRWEALPNARLYLFNICVCDLQLEGKKLGSDAERYLIRLL